MDDKTMKTLVKNAKKNKGKPKEKGGLLFKGIVLAFLILHALILFVLLYCAIITGLKSNNHFNSTGFFSIPDFDFSSLAGVFSYRIFVTRAPNGIPIFPHVLLYTVLYTVGCSFLGALVPCLVAYVVAKFKNVVSTILLTIVVVTMTIPIVGNTPSMISIMQTLNIYDTIWGTWILRANFLGMYFLVYVAAFRSLPDSYMEAAYVDGASEWRVMLTIMLPLVKTIFATVMVLQFVDCWNDYNTPLLYMPNFPTLSYAVYELSTSTDTGNATMPKRMASCLIMVIPTIALFVVFKDKLMGNLSMGGVKG